MEGRVAYPMESRGNFITFEERRLGEGTEEPVDMNCFVKIYVLGRKRRLPLYLVVLLYSSLTCRHLVAFGGAI